MTPKEAGRELDGQIAQKVFGWPVRARPKHEHGHNHSDLIWEYWCEPPPMGADPEFLNPAGWQKIPLFSTRIEFAWLVVEKMRERGQRLYTHERDETPRRWVARFSTAGEWASAESAPLAICLAALSAVGVPSVGDAG